MGFGSLAAHAILRQSQATRDGAYRTRTSDNYFLYYNTL
jgi:hypothetical protein